MKLSVREDVLCYIWFGRHIVSIAGGGLLLYDCFKTVFFLLLFVCAALYKLYYSNIVVAFKSQSKV